MVSKTMVSLIIDTCMVLKKEHSTNPTPLHTWGGGPLYFVSITSTKGDHKDMRLKICCLFIPN